MVARRLKLYNSNNNKIRFLNVPIFIEGKHWVFALMPKQH